MVLNDYEHVTITDFLGRARRYAVIRPLGDGYLAHVYLMRDLHDDAPVVVKVLNRRHAQADQKAAEFLREADFLQQLADRPEVVDLRAPGKGEIVLEESIRLPCTLQEYVGEPYRPLPELVETGLSEQTGLAICRQFASLLDYIHSHSIIYTDLKPEHIYWNGTEIKVIDWNVVKDLSSADRNTVGEAVAKALQTFGQVMYYLFTGRSMVGWVEGPSITALVSGSFSGTHIDFADTTTGEELSLGTRLIIERSLDESGDNSYPSAAVLEEALGQHALRLNQVAIEPMTQSRAALSKGLAALGASDYEDAIAYFKEAAHSTPGLITQSYLVATRIRQDERVSEVLKDQAEENLALFRMAFQEGDLMTALDALVSGRTALPEHREIEILHQLTTQVARFVDEAEEALAAGDYAAAQHALRRARALEPSVPFLQERLQTVEAFQTHLATGEQSLKAGRFSEAATALEMLLNHMPQSPSIEQLWVAAKLGQGETALERGAFAEARDAFDAVLERQPENEAAHAGLADVEERQQRIQQLESWLTQGRTAFHVGDYDKSLQCINAALELEPEHAEARQLLADVQQAQQAERARRVRRWLEKGHQAMAGGAYAEAIQCFEQAAALDPESEANVLRARAEAAQARAEQFQALLHKAHAAFRGEDYDTAVQYFEEAVDLCPEILDARRGLTLARQRQAEVRAHEVQSLLATGRAALSAGNHEDALHHFERAASLGSDSEIAGYIEKAFQIRDLVQSAQAAEVRGDLQEALKYYTRAMDIDPLPGLEGQLARMRAEVRTATQEQVNWLIERATAHLESAPEQAVAWLEQARDLDPNHERVAELLLTAQEHLRRRRLDLRRLLETGQAALYAGDGAAAERAFTEALVLDPELEEARAGLPQAQQLRQHLQAAQRAAGGHDYEGAAAELWKALEIAPDSPHVQQQWRHVQCEALLQRARQATDEGAHAEALALLDEALALNPDHDAGHELKQTVEADAEAARRAEEAAAHQARMQQVETLMADAEARIEAGDYAATLQAIESAIELMPDNAELARRRREVIQQKARYDRARTLMNQGWRFEMKEQYAEAAEAYEIAAHLTPESGVETEARVRAAQARHKHRQQRWRHLLRRILGFPLAEAVHTDELGNDGT
ncbi:MAG: tetratricopeptide repeat protein [Anaerolineae bacterium]